MGKKSEIDYRKIFIGSFYLSIFILVVLLIISLKIYTFSGWSLIFIYSIFITTFMFSRVIGSFLYKPYEQRRVARGKEELIKNYRPSVTFVVPCKNEEKSIYRTIASCCHVDYPREKIEVIAINDGSTDSTLSEMMRAKEDFSKYDIQIINFKINKGKRHGMEVGFKKSKNEIVIQLDSDSFPLRDSVKEIVKPFVDPRVGATVGHTDPDNSDINILTKMQNAYYFMSFRALKATESVFDMVFCCSGCFSAYRKSYVLPILDKWLDEKFLGKTVTFGDDRALTNWIIRQGYKTVYVAEAKATTVVPETIKVFLKQQVRWKKGWFINSIRIAPEVVRRDKFVAFTYFLPLIALTLLTPFIAFKALILNPLFFGIAPWLYIIGILLVAFLMFMHYNYHEGGKYGKYMIAWGILNMTILSYVLVYALFDLRNMAWGTR